MFSGARCAGPVQAGGGAAAHIYRPQQPGERPRVRGGAGTRSAVVGGFCCQCANVSVSLLLLQELERIEGLIKGEAEEEEEEVVEDEEHMHSAGGLTAPLAFL